MAMETGRRMVSAESGRMVELGHPWIIADGSTKKWPAAQAGDLLELFDPEGRFIGTALADPAERVVARLISRKKIQLDLNWLKNTHTEGGQAPAGFHKSGRDRCLPACQRRR